MRIMGIDASPSTTGIAIYDTELEDFVMVTKIRTSIKKETPTLAKRIHQIAVEISQLIFWEAVDVVVIEDVYIQQLSSAIPLAQTRGAIQEVVYDLELNDLWTIESSKIKKAVAGKGNASKQDVYDAIKTKYKHSKVVQDALGEQLISKNNANKNEDMADACAIVDAYLIDPTLAHPA